MKPLSGYEQAAIDWRMRAEKAEAELAWLRSEIKQQGSKDEQAISAIVGACRIQYSKAVVLHALHKASPKPAPHFLLCQAMIDGGSLADDPTEKLINVQIYHLRKFFTARGMAERGIVTHWNYGYSLTPEAKALVDQLVDAL